MVQGKLKWVLFNVQPNFLQFGLIPNDVVVVASLPDGKRLVQAFCDAAFQLIDDSADG